jgi:hypothetical protein
MPRLRYMVSVEGGARCPAYGIVLVAGNEVRREGAYHDIPPIWLAY